MELNITLVVQLAIFLIGVLWLSVVLFRPMMRLLEEREKRISGTRREAEKLLSSGGEKTGIIEIRLEEARAQALEERQQLRGEGQKVYNEAVNEARDQAQEKIGKARGEIEQAREAAAKDLKAESDALAALIVKRVMTQPGGEA